MTKANYTDINDGKKAAMSLCMYVCMRLYAYMDQTAKRLFHKVPLSTEVWHSELSQTDLTSPGSSVTSTSVLQLAMGLIDSSTGGTTKLLLTGSHNPWPRL